MCMLDPAGKFWVRTDCFESNITAFNETLSALCTTHTGMELWSHRRFTNVAHCLRDGVYLSDEGLKHNYFSLRRAVVHNI